MTVRAFSYDGAGNILSDSRVGTSYVYTYNNRNRLATVTVGGSLRGTYAYNGLEQLAIRVMTDQTPSGTVHSLYDRAGNLIAETDGTGPAGTVREYIWLPEAEIAPTSGSRTAVARPMAVVSDVSTSPVLSWVHVDHLHRPIRITSAVKLQVWEAVWQPWGEAHSINGSVALDLRLPGQWFQIEAGLHYNWHRHYDPSIGRYTQPDPLGFVDGPSVYGYAKAAPQQLVDPGGRQVAIPLPTLAAICAANPWACGAAVLGTGAYMCYRAIRGGRGRAYDRCIAAANGSTDDWQAFCDSIPSIVRGNVAGNDSAIGECNRKTLESRQMKINWCENQFGGH